MSSEPASTGPPETSAAEEDQAIRERVRLLMSQLLRQGQIDPEGVKERLPCRRERGVGAGKW
jgi:hypothetical protein